MNISIGLTEGPAVAGENMELKKTTLAAGGDSGIRGETCRHFSRDGETGHCC
jgi:hypothetical protein